MGIDIDLAHAGMESHALALDIDNSNTVEHDGDAADAPVGRGERAVAGHCVR